MAACTIEFDLWVVEGHAAIATLAPMGRYCYDEAIIGAGPDRQRILLRTPAFEQRDSLIIRSAAEGVCRLRIQPVSVTERDPPPGEVEELAALESLMASASQLGAMDLAGGMFGTRARGAAQEALGGVATWAGLALVAVDDPRCSRWLDALDNRQLVDLAATMVVEANASRTPGWRFDWARRQADPHWQLRVAVWRAMRERCPASELDLPWLDGTTVRMPLGSDISLPLFTLGQFEPNICRIVRAMLRQGDTFVDIGANEGLYTLFAAHAVGQSGLVVAIEPSPREVRRLRQNLASNAVGDRVIVVEQAMDAGAGWADFAIAEATHAGQNAFADRFDERAGLTQTRPTGTMTLDMLALRLTPRRPNIIKMDVEGAEFDVLQGGSWVVETVRPIWMIEIGRTDAKADMRVVRKLESAGYTLFAIDDVAGAAVRPSGDEDWVDVENVIAVPTEQLAERWPEALDEAFAQNSAPSAKA